MKYCRYLWEWKKIHANFILNISACHRHWAKNTRSILMSIWTWCWEYQQMLRILQNTTHMQTEYSQNSKNTKILMYKFAFLQHLQTYFGILQILMSEVPTEFFSKFSKICPCESVQICFCLYLSYLLLFVFCVTK